jgi:hypothetical protein
MSDDREISAEQERAEASEATDRKHGEHILAVMKAARERRRKDPLLEVLEQAYQGNLKPDDAA